MKWTGARPTVRYRDGTMEGLQGKKAANSEQFGPRGEPFSVPVDRHDVARVLQRDVDGAEAFQVAFAKVMASPALVELQAEQRDEQGRVVEQGRHSTREMVSIERDMAISADRMAEGRGFGVAGGHVDAAIGAQQRAGIRQHADARGGAEARPGGSGRRISPATSSRKAKYVGGSGSAAIALSRPNSLR